MWKNWLPLKGHIDEILPAPLEKSGNLIWYGEWSPCVKYGVRWYRYSNNHLLSYWVLLNTGIEVYYAVCVCLCIYCETVTKIYYFYTRRVRSPNGGRRPLHRRATPRSGLPSFSPNCWGTGGGWGVGWKWAPIGDLQYQTHMQAPKYDVQFLRSEALRSSSSRTRQIKECKIR